MSNILTGADLKRFRKKHHLTQKQVAKYTFYSTSHIAHIEQNNWPINKLLADALRQYNKKVNDIQQTPLTKIWLALYFRKEGASYSRALDELSSTLEELSKKDLDDIAPNEIKRTLENINRVLKGLTSSNNIEPVKTATVKKHIRSTTN